MTTEIYKPRPISGFPEWLPGERRLEQRWMDHIRKTFEGYGYINIETPAVEDVNVLQAKGEITKEIYALHRHLAEASDKDDARLALHFDLTVPLARYVAQHFDKLSFPFKRYAMQKVWRGERPQKGRMREFYQCDIDVIAVDNLPLHFDAEMPAVMHEIFSGLGFKSQVRISNRKILLGLLEGHNVDGTAVLQQIDKLEKIGREKVIAELTAIGAGHLADTLLDIVTKNDVASIKPVNATMEEGLKELSFVLDALKHLPEGAAVADLSITRGLDYYTGTVYETRLLDVPEFTGSVCSGGRYEDLAGRFIRKKLPGVGISIGLSRLFEVLLDAGKIQPLNPSPTDILVTFANDGARSEAMQVAAQLRERYNVEVFHNSDVKKAFTYAEKKGIRYVWFPAGGDRPSHSVKDLTTGEQKTAEPDTF